MSECSEGQGNPGLRGGSVELHSRARLSTQSPTPIKNMKDYELKVRTASIQFVGKHLEEKLKNKTMRASDSKWTISYQCKGSMRFLSPT